MEGSGNLIIDRFAQQQTNKLLRYNGLAHLLTMAPTRAGKGVGTIIPNLLLFDRSVICIDLSHRVPVPAARSGSRLISAGCDC